MTDRQSFFERLFSLKLRETDVYLTLPLVLALRVIVLTEYGAHHQLQKYDEAIIDPKPSSKTFTTRRPTTEWLLKSLDNIIWLTITPDGVQHHYVIPLTETQRPILRLLHHSTDIYDGLAAEEVNQKLPFNSRK